MSYVAFLDYPGGFASGRLTHFQRFFWDQDTNIRFFDGRASEFRAFLNDARSYIIWNDTLLSSYTIDLLNTNIHRGKRALIRLSPNSTKINALLYPFTVRATTIGIYIHGSEREMLIERSFFPLCFVDDEILSGVDKVVISNPYLIDFGSNAESVLTVPLTEVGLLDYANDLWSEWSGSSIPSIVRSSPSGCSGEVIVYAGSLFADTMKATRGILANDKLARNMIRWLLGAPEPPGIGASRAYPKYEKVERKLHIFCTRVLKHAYGMEWWVVGVPEHVRRKCEDRRSTEKSKLRPESYLDLVDYDKIMRSQWHVFSDWLNEVGWGKGRTSGLAWIGSLNEIRKRIAHPTRMAVGGSLSSQDLSFLEEILKKIDILYEAVGGWLNQESN